MLMSCHNTVDIDSWAAVVSHSSLMVKDCEWDDSEKIWAGDLPFKSGRAWSSKSAALRYLEDPWDFLVFFFRERLANGSILSTKVPEFMVYKVYEPGLSLQHYN